MRRSGRSSRGDRPPTRDTASLSAVHATFEIICLPRRLGRVLGLRTAFKLAWSLYDDIPDLNTSTNALFYYGYGTAVFLKTHRKCSVTADVDNGLARLAFECPPACHNSPILGRTHSMADRVTASRLLCC